MQLRTFEGTGLVTSAIGLNCLSFTTGCATIDPDEAEAILARLPDIGVTFVDASDFTTDGDVEVMVGNAVRDRRDELLLASRGGARWAPSGAVRGIDGSPDALRSACDRTLRRMGVDHLDVYYLSCVDPAVPLADSVGALAGLIGAGKIRYIGLSGVTADELRRAAAVHPVAMVSAEYSLMQRDIESGLLGAAGELGAGLAAYSPLARGLLAGWPTSLDQLAVDDYRHADQRFRPETFAHNRSLIAAIEGLAADQDLSVCRLALAWLLARDTSIVAMPGTRSLTHLELDVSAADVSIGAELHARLSALLAPEHIADAR
jgi:aryl-alcohol dehydrogenase-like predicted oxidoreductase